jgi:neutral ceramidase
MSASSWRAGVASVAITPAEPMWLAGWAARREPARRAAMELHGKALALEDADGGRVVIVTADLIAIPAAVARAVAARVAETCGLTRDRLLFNASHTHTGPEVRPDKVPFFEIPDAYAARIAPYVAEVEEKLAYVIALAMERLAPVHLRVGATGAGFAINRRNPKGPVDRDVPVLVVEAVGAKEAPVIAIVFGYACHNLTLAPTCCEFHGDYAGIAQEALEKKFPGAVALFLAGAGADLDPTPRGTLESAIAHGQALGDVVGLLVAAGVPACRTDSLVPPRQAGAPAATMAAVRGTLRVAFEEIILDLDPLPTADDLRVDLASEDLPRRRKAKFLLDAYSAKESLPRSIACPVQAITFGDELLLIALGGEPVVEFALRLKADVVGPLVWVAGYSNDMFGYLPTRRVREEGGYEGGRATLWSALPAPIASTAEQRVIDAVRSLAPVVRAAGHRTERVPTSQDSKH